MLRWNWAVAAAVAAAEAAAKAATQIMELKL